MSKHRSSVQYIIMYDCCYWLRYTLLAWGITKKQVLYLIILESTHFWVTVSVSPVPSGDSMCTVVSGTVFIVIRLHASDRIKLITVHQRIFDTFCGKLMIVRHTDIWMWCMIKHRRSQTKTDSGRNVSPTNLMCEYLSLVCRQCVGFRLWERTKQ